SYSWKLANIYDMSQLAAVAFIQENSTKEVLQAGYSAPSFPMQLNITSNNNEVAKIAGTNAQAVFNVVFKASNNSATSYRLKLTKSQPPSVWSANLSVAGQLFADSSKLTLAATWTPNV